MTETDIDTTRLLAMYQADDGLILDVLTRACQGMTYNPDGQGAPLVGYPFGSVAEMAREVVARLVAARDAALARADTEHAARVRLVEQYDALDAEAVAVKDELDRLRAEQSDPAYLYAGSRIHRAAIEVRNSEIDRYLKELIHIQKIIGLKDGAGENGERLMTRLQELIDARDNFATEHSRALLRVGALEGLLQRTTEYNIFHWASCAGYDGDKTLGCECGLMALLADIDAALVGKDGTG